jgi:hypothetical protein
MGFNEEEFEDEMSESQRISLEEDVLESAITNSYLMLTGKVRFSDLAKDITGDIITVTIYDPDDGPTRTQLNVIIKFFEESEEYEKCAEIKKILDEMDPEK